MDKIHRVGTYGILLQDEKIALVKKIKGPYEGLLDLPGGAIEFGESSLDALKREIKEELALNTSEIKIYDSYSYLGICKKNIPFKFHHLGIIYKVSLFEPIANAIPEDDWNWYLIDSLALNTLTPFAKKALTSLNDHLYLE